MKQIDVYLLVMLAWAATCGLLCWVLDPRGWWFAAWMAAVMASSHFVAKLTWRLTVERDE